MATCAAKQDYKVTEGFDSSLLDWMNETVDQSGTAVDASRSTMRAHITDHLMINSRAHNTIINEATKSGHCEKSKLRPVTTKNHSPGGEVGTEGQFQAKGATKVEWTHFKLTPQHFAEQNSGFLPELDGTH